MKKIIQNINGVWDNFIQNEFKKSYFDSILKKIEEDKRNGITILPNENLIFNAFKLCDYNNIKVVVIGQDPYHTKNVADGLAFSSQQAKTPPSLKNIFKEIYNSLGIKEDFNVFFKTNSLITWAKQGMFLINTSLTVQEGKPNSHSKIGWDMFVKNTIKEINNNNKPVLFLLWGNNAKKFEHLITNKTHKVLKSAHPSPFSVRRGFEGNNHFVIMKEFLKNIYNINFEFRT